MSKATPDLKAKQQLDVNLLALVPTAVKRALFDLALDHFDNSQFEEDGSSIVGAT